LAIGELSSYPQPGRRGQIATFMTFCAQYS